MSLVSRFSSLVDDVENLFIPPFKGLPIVTGLIFALFSFSTLSDSQIARGQLSDPDDYLYLVQAQDLLNGHDWFDHIQYRMNPPEGTYIHYSQILSSFYAGCIFLLHFFMENTSAAIVTAGVLPVFYLILLLYVAFKLTQTLVHRDWGGLAIYMVFFSVMNLTAFLPGHIDHHGLEGLLALSAYGCITQMLLNPASKKWPIAAGLLLALGLVIALEIIVALCLLTACVGVWSMVSGSKAARSGSLFALTLFIASFLLLLATHSLDRLFIATSQAYSITYVALTGCFALCFIGNLLVPNKISLWIRLAIGSCLAMISGILFLHYFPDMKNGPYGDTPPDVAKIVFSVAPEAWPVYSPNVPWYKVFLPVSCPVFGVLASLFMVKIESSSPKRWMWGMLGLVLAVCLLLALFDQSRLLTYVEVFDTFPIMAVMFYNWEKVSTLSKNKRLFTYVGLVVLILFVIVSSGSPVIYDDSSNEVSDHSDPHQTKDNCDMDNLAQVMRDRSAYGDHSRLIINSANEGTEILFMTSHKILSAPYHMNIDGNLDATHFFSTQNPDEAKAIAQRRHAELVLLCPLSLQMKLYDSISGNSFAHQIATGHVPRWLKPVKIKQSPDDKLLLFEVL